MGKLATASCGPETRRSQARPSGKDRNRSTAPLDETASGQRGIGNLTLQYSSARPQSSPVLGEGSFDPYLESVVDLTNRDLVDAILVTEDWLKKNGAVDPDHEAYTVRRDRLECERRARVERGHLWLETVHDRQSYRLFQLISGAHDALDVVAVENDELVNGPAGAISARPPGGVRRKGLARPNR